MSATMKRILTGAELKSLSGRSDLRGAARLAVHVTFILAAGTLVALSNAWTVLPAMALLGVLQAALFAPIHETMHQTAFRSRRANTVAGWLAACPSLLNWHFYTAFHLAHHRHTQDPALDPELLVPPPSTLDGYAMRVLALPYWRTRLTVCADAWRGDMRRYPYIPERAVPRVIRSLRAMTLFVAAGAALSAWAFGPWTPVVFWLGPQLLGQPFLRLYLLTEHTLCTEDANALTNTRTTLTNGLIRLVMWNMSYHAEHHLYPSIPFHRLPDAHLAIRSRLAVVQDGYRRWHAGYIRTLRRA